jgi:N-acetylglucosamine-6-sulfatase
VFDPYNLNKEWIKWGWDYWHVTDNGYREFNYDLHENEVTNYYGAGDANYMTYVLSSKAQDFINAHTREPFFLEIATFAPHWPYTPANADQYKFPGLTLPPEVGNYQLPVNPPNWQKDIPPLQPNEIDGMNTGFRKRAQSVQAIDKMINNIRALLIEKGLDRNTYIFFSSDNGYHMGEFNFHEGKMTPYDFDINVPLIVVGPGVPHQAVPAIAQTVDLAPTFTDLAQLSGPLPTRPDGRSLVEWLHGQTPSAWRKMVLVEHHDPLVDRTDPDYDGFAAPPNYAALRIRDDSAATPMIAMYVEYEGKDAAGTPIVEPCYYDLTTDPYERNNIYQSLSNERKQELHALLENNRTCGQAGKPMCWTVQQ